MTKKTEEKEASTISKEEMERRKNEINKFHTDQIPFLETQLKYENLLTEIEESRLRRAMSQIRMAQMLAPDPEEDPEENSNKDSDKPVMRTLRKEVTNEDK